MTTNSDRASAKIYQFPARGRFAASGPSGHRNDTETTATLPSPPVVKAAVGSGWYHEAAIQDAERARKN